jgi:hypothetical protein
MEQIRKVSMGRDELLEKNFVELKQRLSLNNEGKNINCCVQMASTLELN